MSAPQILNVRNGGSATSQKGSRAAGPVISDRGGMFVALEGEALDGASLRVTWNLLAEKNDGPNVPCGAAIALARKLSAAAALPRGAMPCMGLLTVEEFLEPLSHLRISEQVSVEGGGDDRT
jgi:hypothetical protein